MNSHVQLDSEGNFLRLIPAGLPIEWDDNNYCTPEALVKDGKAEQFGVYELQETPQPEIDTLRQYLVFSPVLKDVVWIEDWEVCTYSEDQIYANIAAKKAEEDSIIKDKIEKLWQAADRYTSSFISGVAIGILTIGVLQQKPKALAVSDWSSRVWAEYYVRKALVTRDSEDNHDFSSFGEIPHSVPELQEELGF